LIPVESSRVLMLAVHMDSVLKALFAGIGIDIPTGLSKCQHSTSMEYGYNRRMFLMRRALTAEY